MPEWINEQFSTSTNASLKEYELERGIQVKYVPKIHIMTPLITSDVATSRLETIARQIKLQQTDYLFLDQFSRSFLIGSKEVVANKIDISVPESEAQAKLIRQRNKKEQSNDLKILTPSKDLAWMFGVLSAGGYTRPEVNYITLRSRHAEFLEAFRKIGEKLFRVNAYLSKDIVRFHNKTLTNILGDLRSPNWPTTIIERHIWVTTNDQYIWCFLEGYLDKSGQVTSAQSIKRIEFLTSCENSGSFLADMLVKVGVERPLIDYKSSRKLRKLQGVYISNIKDVKRIASNVSLKVTEKERRLAQLRSFIPQFERPINATDSDLIYEYKRLKKILGRIPTSYDIQELKKRRQTRYHYKSYSGMFGSGSFVKASEYLGKITSDKKD